MILDPLNHNSHFNVIVRCLHRRQLVNGTTYDPSHVPSLTNPDLEDSDAILTF